MPLTDSPSNLASYYTCNLCGIHSQVLVEKKDEDGNVIQDENWQPILVNDEPTASFEMGEHMEEAHPEPNDDE